MLKTWEHTTMVNHEGCDNCKGCGALTWKIDMRRGLCIECLFKYTKELEGLLHEFLDTMKSHRDDPAANGLAPLISVEGKAVAKLGRPKQ